jgi:hypothetical protein
MAGNEIERLHERIDRLEDNLGVKLDSLVKESAAIAVNCPRCQRFILGNGDKQPAEARLSKLEEANHHVKWFLGAVVGGVLYGGGEWIWSLIAKTR